MKRRISAAMMVSGTILLLLSMIFSTVSFAAPALGRQNADGPTTCGPSHSPPFCVGEPFDQVVWDDVHEKCVKCEFKGIHHKDGEAICSAGGGAVACPGCTPNTTQQCGTDVGVCEYGTETCNINFQWGPCEGGVQPSTEVCDGQDNDCDGTIDNGFDCAVGATQQCGTSDVGECAYGTETCNASCQWAGCDAVEPSAEICDDGLDNDCDGLTDTEDPDCQQVECTTPDQCPAGNACQTPTCVNNVCGLEDKPNGTSCDDEDLCTDTDVCTQGVCAGTLKDCSSFDGQCSVGVCESGTGDCVAEPANEGGSCDDGDICTEPDLCSAGDCSGSQVAPRPCYTGDSATRNVGVCQDGTETCSSNTWGECVGEVTPGTEVCDAAKLDEDCDGSQNEDCPCKEGDTIPCGTDEGECVAGTQTCDSTGTWGECVGAVGPSAEICDGLDNDCDGSVDEGLGTTTCGVGECQETVDNCVDGEPQECVPGEPTAEICDDKENDCDGKIDEGGVCGAPPPEREREPEPEPEPAPTPTPTPVVEVLGVEELPTAGIMPVGAALPILPMIFSSLALIGGGLLLWGDEDE